MRQVAYVPDAGHARLIELCQADPAMSAVALTTEEEGVALLAGAWLGGARGVLLMQSSGIGNCVNLLSLNQSCRLPLLAAVTMRGEWGEFNPWQLADGPGRGRGACRSRASSSSASRRRSAPARRWRPPARMAFEGHVPLAVLIAQRLVGAKSFAR